MGEERQEWRGAGPSTSAGVEAGGQSESTGVEARGLVGAARLVLVDFDGPLARLLPGDCWLEVAAEVRSRAGELGGAALEDALGGEQDHVQCLRRAGELAPQVAPPLTDLVTRLELEAAAQVAPTVHGVDFLEQSLDRGAAVVVVTNNDPRVVTMVLDPARPGLAGRLTGILGRVPGRLDALKPSPAMLLQALEQAGSAATAAVFLGDSADGQTCSRPVPARWSLTWVICSVPAAECAGRSPAYPSEVLTLRDERRPRSPHTRG